MTYDYVAGDIELDLLLRAAETGGWALVDGALVIMAGLAAIEAGRRDSAVAVEISEFSTQ